SVEEIIPESAYESSYCGLNNGQIRLSNLKNTIRVEWYNGSNVKVGEGPVLNNVGPGTYYAKCFNGNCYVQTFPLTLTDKDFSIHSDAVVITQPSCNRA